jgi:putative heme-binding domain-containing protein
LAFNVAQLDRDVSRGESRISQLVDFRQMGLLVDAPTPDGEKDAAPPPARPRLAAAWDPATPLADRGRAYLHVNCGSCHRFGGGGTADIQLNHEVSLEASRTLDVAPGQGGFGIPNPRIIAPGDPSRSTLFYRLASAGAGHMPPIGPSLVDHRGVTLIYDWIRHLGPRQSFDRDIASIVAGTEPPADTVGGDDAISRLLGSMPGALELAHAVRQQRLPTAARDAVLEAAASHPEPAVAAVFEPFLAPGRLEPRLGTAIDPEAILLLKGDPSRGRWLYLHAASLQCRNCHAVEDGDRNLGPSLTDIGRRLDRRQILAAIIEPSKEIADAYRTWVVQTSDGRMLTGLIVSRSAKGLVLRDAEGNRSELAADDIEAEVPQVISAMPENTLRDLTPRQAADLLAYLSTCR